jgi:Trypsin-like peptidase domain
LEEEKMMERISEEGVEALRSMAGPVGGQLREGGLESAGSGPSLAERLELSQANLARMLEAIFPGDTRRQEQAALAHKLAREALQVIEGGPGAASVPVEELSQGLEVVVHTDGSRPSYLVRDDKVIQATAPSTGPLAIAVAEAKEALPEVLQAIGRVNRGLLNQHTGTGWLIGPNVILTNRHVAELLTDEDENGVPRVRSGVTPTIDFGHEHVVGGKGIGSRWRRKITELLFLGQSPGTSAPLDVAVFRLGPGDRPAKPLPISKSKPGVGSIVAVSGYPGAPDPNDPRSKIISSLFADLWGVKRFAPGFVTGGKQGQLFHDASTLGGNSGSPVLTLDPVVGVAIHYGGLTDNSRNNAEALGQVIKLEGRKGLPFKTLGKAFGDLGTQIT